MEGARYEGEILRFRLQAAPAEASGPPARGDVAASAPEEWLVELRVGRELLAAPAWDRLGARDVARCAEHFLREELQRQGLPTGARPRFILDEHTDTGAYLDGPPWGGDAPAPGTPFDLPGPPRTQGAAGGA